MRKYRSTTNRVIFFLAYWNCVSFLLASAFSPANLVSIEVSTSTGRLPRAQIQSTLPAAAAADADNSSSNGNDPLEELDQSRKDNLFQCLLRDLQIEGVPLLECDAFQAHTLQAALWTTMAELSEQDDPQKVCLVLEGTGVEALRTFVDDFLVLKTQGRLMDHLPELERFSIAVVGKGAGPAIVIETARKLTNAMPTTVSSFDEQRINAAIKAFIDRLIVGQGVCPYTKSSNQAPQGLEHVNIYPGPIGYRYCGFPEVCHAMSSFWNCICELLSVPDDKLSSVILSMPAIGTTDDDGGDDDGFGRFAAVAELISRSLCLYRGDDVFEPLHFHPAYDRNRVFPKDKPAHGHLPPISWLRPMLRQNGNLAEADNLSDNDLEVSNFQRRAPFAAVVIKRVSHFEALAGSANEIVSLELEDGQVEKASGVPSYARNTIQLAAEGAAKLREALDSEIAFGSQ